MALFYLIRHGEPDYEAVADDSRLMDAKFIISSPYTRALQTAAIILRKINKEIIIEPELHEWIPDRTNMLSSGEEADRLSREFKKYKGVYPENVEMRWETLASLQGRMKRIADKYAEYRKIIIVGHGMAFRTLTYIEKMAPAEIIECRYDKGQADSEYFFG